MTKIMYARKMAWATFWLSVLGMWQRIHIPKKISGAYAWVISQCGFVYTGDWEMAKDL